MSPTPYSVVTHWLLPIRAFLGRPEVQRWLPLRKVWVGALAAALVVAAQAIGVPDILPQGWAEVAAYAIAAYLVPDPGQLIEVGPGEYVTPDGDFYLDAYPAPVVTEDPLTDPDGPGVV